MTQYLFTITVHLSRMMEYKVAMTVSKELSLALRRYNKTLQVRCLQVTHKSITCSNGVMASTLVYTAY